MSIHPLLDPTGTRMYAEAQEAGDAVARQFAANADAVDDLTEHLRNRPPRFIVTCARGSSDHAATYGKYLLETQLGLVVASASPSVGSVYAAPLQLRSVSLIFFNGACVYSGTIQGNRISGNALANKTRFTWSVAR